LPLQVAAFTSSSLSFGLVTTTGVRQQAGANHHPERRVHAFVKTSRAQDPDGARVLVEARFA